MLSDKSQTLSETHAREMSDTLTREIQVSAHTDTYTAMQLAHIADLQEHLFKTQDDKEILQAQVVERSSSSTSVNNQLGLLKEILKTFTTQDQLHQLSQLLLASDTHKVKSVENSSTKGEKFLEKFGEKFLEKFLETFGEASTRELKKI